ncbi:hypothetical protein EVC37_25815 [Methylocaldum sp. BRCS4]|jgi:hypothetical protein|uniref:hypothetical protein n=1 Tax=Methylocaldum sp. GT1BB TaxID=3438963 RepID=UPI000A327E38|nr:hypothetical protein [Methylocaldum sp. BRCS4]
MDFYDNKLRFVHEYLESTELARTFLSGDGIRLDGDELQPYDIIELPKVEMLVSEFAQLFCVFNNSRVHKQGSNEVSADGAPPGLYFTVINTHVIQNQHKNRIGLVREGESEEIFIDELFLDHFFLHNRTPPLLGTLAFALCAMTAHNAGIQAIELIGAGDAKTPGKFIGFKVWPKLGFDAPVALEELVEAPLLQDCETIQQIIARDPAWWDSNGSQRLMRFDLTPDSASWSKLLSYVCEKFQIEAAP